MSQDSRKIAYNYVLLKIIGYFIQSAVLNTENRCFGVFFPILPDAGWKLQSEITFFKPFSLIKETF